MSRFHDSIRAFHEVFASRGLRRVQLALAGSVVGDWAFGIALSVYAFEANGAAAVGLLLLGRWTAAALAAPFTAVLADRYRRRTVMMASDAIRAALIAVAAVTVWSSGPSGVVYAMAVLTMVVSTAFQPAQTALLPSLTSTPDQLTAANVVTSTIESVGTFVGPALGGLLLVWVGIGTVMAIDAVSFVWSLLMLSGIPRGEAPERGEEAPQFLTEVGDGFRAVGQNRRIQVIIGLYGAQTFVSGALTVLVVVMALQLLGMGQSGVGTLNAAVGIGGVVGSVVTAALVGRGRLAANFAAGLIAWGVPIALIAVFTRSGFAFAMLLIVGVGNVLVDVAALTMLQRVAADEVLGRVFGVMEAVLSITVGIGAAVTPLVIDAVGVRGALLATGAVLPVLVVITWPLLSRADPGALQPERVQLMRGVPFLAPLDEPVLERIGTLLEPVPATAGTAVFQQGDRGDRFYLIERGDVAVERDGAVIARLGPGGYFGEIALVQDVPRTATVRPLTDCSLLALDRDEFIAAVTGHAPSREAADAVISTRLGTLRAGAASL
ncbi:MAG TPA: MFS transporter [Gaiellales bacterium]|nr:MFS transporter [Gaiellales bacterium]